MTSSTAQAIRAEWVATTQASPWQTKDPLTVVPASGNA